MENKPEYFKEFEKSLDKKLERFVTKDDLKNLVTKDDLTSALQSQTKELQDYTDEVAASILDAVDAGFTRVNRRLDSRDHRLDRLEKDVKVIKGAINI